MKTTLRKNGQKMLTMKVEFHLNVNEIAMAICNYAKYKMEADQIVDAVKTETPERLMKWVRSEMFDRGSLTIEYCDDVESETTDEVAKILCERFPQWNA